MTRMLHSMNNNCLQVFKGTAVIQEKKTAVAVKLYTTKFTDLTRAQIFEVREAAESASHLERV